MVGLFVLALFVAALLLFLVQPLFARLVLPLLGGTPAVWTTCMVFFQAALLTGYAYAHVLPAWLGVRRHALLHLALMVAVLLVLPVALPSGWAPPADGSAILWLLGVLTVSVGLPFFVVATSGPLLQCWYAQTRAASAGDPYFLYAASNAGSLLGLLCYPLLLEPLLPLADQGRVWTAGYLALLLLIGGCAVAVWRSERPAAQGEATFRLRVGFREGRWVLLAFVPSSLLLSVTTYLTTDVAAIPLLWVVPLALYLLTFIAAFNRWPPLPLTFLARWAPLVVLVVTLAMLTEATEPVWLLVPLHLLALVWLGLVCHGQLARERPPAEELTAFYLWLAVGGVLGGVFNALLAPLLFDRLLEYPLVLVLACVLLPPFRPRPEGESMTLRDVLLPAGLGVLTLALIGGARIAHLPPGQLSIAVIFAAPTVLCYTLHERPLRFGLGIGALLLASAFYPGIYGTVDHRERSFFGVHRVTRDPTGTFRQLIHGNTVHGQQFLDPARRGEALTYYHRTGPAGRTLLALRGDPRLQRLAFVGLGAGALASYGEEGQRWTFFEIDPSVIHVARDTGQFTYLADSAAEVDVVRGDARLTLARSEERFGVIVVDAFTSDSIPMHLLTREALRVYREHLTPDGLLLFHVSNRYLELEPVLAALAVDADPPMLCLSWDDHMANRENGKLRSQWVLLASAEADLAAMKQRMLWGRVQPTPGVPVWRDDYSDLLSVFRWWGTALD